MRMTFLHTGAALVLGALLAASSVHAQPRALSAPGGVAVIGLGETSDAPPHAWFGGQRVLVSRKGGQWLAVVGLPLDLPPGRHELQVDYGSGSSTRRFDVSPRHYAEQRITLKDASRVVLSPADEKRAANEIVRIGLLKRHWRETDETGGDAMTFLLPAEGRLSGRFGVRRVFNGEPRSPHSGLDVAVARGTPVGAAAAGQVLAVDDYFFNGKTVFVDHGQGLISMYCHLERIAVQAGDWVGQRQEIGSSGMSGRASGPHLHWSVILNGTMVDPELFVKMKKSH